MNDRIRAIQTARRWIRDNSLFLDTETTGLSGDAEICELSVVDAAGSVLMDTLVRPYQPIPREATDLHDITNAMVSEAPTFAEVLPDLKKIVYRRILITYNFMFDLRLIGQSARIYRLNPNLGYEACYCAMRLYAQFALSQDICPTF